MTAVAPAAVQVCLARMKMLLALLLLVLVFPGGSAQAKPTQEHQARLAVANWLKMEANPMGLALGRQVRQVATYRDAASEPLYYIVYLNPQGFVIVPADDVVEPIIGFAPAGAFDPAATNPLGALISQDVPGRVHTLRQLEQQTRATGRPGKHHGHMVQAERKWRWLESDGATESPLEYGVSSISDVRVAPLVQSRWSQETEGGVACYNYYTPPNSAGSATNYPSGCVATAMAQLMRFWQWPTAGVGTGSFSIYVCGSPASRSLRGGDGFGGSYDWANMVLDPSSSTSTVQRQAIGALCHDAGVAVNMDYCSDGSGTDTLKSADAFTNTFGYSNAKRGYDNGANLPTAPRNAMVNPNLDAGYPILFGITGSPGGHAIVCDGYGYNASTMYHHLNLGWAGSSDAWYNLPTIDTIGGTFTSVYKCVYNVYTSGSGEIISGRITNAGGAPLSGATVTAARSGGGVYTATTNANGIYALRKIPSASTYTLSVSLAGFSFTPQTVSTGTSTNQSTTTGNLWAVNFVSAPLVINLNEGIDNYVLSFGTGGSAAWAGESATYFFDNDAVQSGAIGNSQSSWLQTTVSGPATISFYWKVSSESGYDYLRFYLDGTLRDSISGGTAWIFKSYDLSSGSHTLRWEYVKDSSLIGGSDCGWVDKLWIYRPPPGPAPPHPTLTPVYRLLLD